MHSRKGWMPVRRAVGLAMMAMVGAWSRQPAVHAGALFPAAQASGAVLEEVLVSARRRGEERAQDVPLAMSVFTADALSNMGLHSVADVAVRVPGFTFAEQVGNQQEWVIRGIGTLRLTGAAAEPSVGAFLDEVYIGRRGTALPPLFDLDRVEVVRGPQGTLYGKNVVGGAVNLITGQPQSTFQGRARLSYGWFDVFDGRDHWTADAYVTGALSPMLAGRLAVHHLQHQGYSYNSRRNERLDDLRSDAIRGALRLQPDAAWTLQLTADASRLRGHGQSRHAFDDPSVPGSGSVVGAGLQSSNVRISDTPWQQWERQDTAGVMARADVQLNDAQTLTYLTAVRHGDFDGRYAATGTVSPPAPTDAAFRQHERYRAVTHDLRLSGVGDALRWGMGAYYLREDTRISDDSIATSYLAMLGPGSAGDALDGRSWYDQRSINHSMAVFGEASVRIRPALRMSAGLRYTQDQKRYRNESRCLDYGAQPDFLLCVVPLGAEVWNISARRRWHESTPRVGLDWQVQSDVLLYLNAARGFKGGGWQGRPGTRDAALYPYDPEVALTYEAGGKGRWRDGRLRASMAVFHTRFDDLQVEQVDDSGLSLITDNAAAARIDGVELQLQAQLLSRTQFQLAGAYLDSRYRRFVDSRGIDLSGRPLARTPQRSLTTGLLHVQPLPQGMNFSAQVDYRWQDAMAWLVDGTVVEPAHGVLDGRLALASLRGWEVALLGSNLTDRLYRSDVIAFLGDVFARFAPPRSYRLQFSQAF